MAATAIQGLILASTSPRRRAMAPWLGLPVVVRAVQVDERPQPGETPRDYVRRIAAAKATAVEDVPQGWWVLAADTAVVANGRILGKPRDPDEARRMLQTLRGRGHWVFTGIALRSQEALVTDVVPTLVFMRAYRDAEIEASIQRGTPFDKAGGYAIQDPHLKPVARLGPEPCYANVVGLPLCRVWRWLHRATGLPFPQLHIRCHEAWGYRCPFFFPPKG